MYSDSGRHFSNVSNYRKKRGRLDPLIKIQKRIVRNICNAKFNVAHTAPLFQNLSILKLSDINSLETLKIIYKHENNLLPNSLQMPESKCSDTHNHRTRQKDNFYLKKYKTNIAANTSVINRGMKAWNNLDQNTRSPKNIKKFSKTIKNNFIDNY